eukprot:2169175-Pleurochrysis_carterae.AAC.1
MLTAIAHRYRRFDPAVEGEGLGRLLSAEGLNEVGRAACALQPSGKSDAKRVPTIARGFLRAQTISKQRGEQLVGLRGREWRSDVGGEEGSCFACTRLNWESKLEVSECLRSPRCPARRHRQGQWACHPRPRPSHRICSPAGRLRTCRLQREPPAVAARGAWWRLLRSPRAARHA